MLVIQHITCPICYRIKKIQSLYPRNNFKQFIISYAIFQLYRMHYGQMVLSLFVYTCIHGGRATCMYTYIHIVVCAIHTYIHWSRSAVSREFSLTLVTNRRLFSAAYGRNTFVLSARKRFP